MKAKILIFVIGVATGATAVFVLPIDSEISRMQSIQLRSQNTVSIDKVGVASELLYENSDLMQRFSHYTDGHHEKVMLCPECSVGEKSIFGEEEVPLHEDSRPDQSLLKDAYEISQGIERMCSSLRVQKESLSYTLQRLRKQAETDTTGKISVQDDTAGENP